MVVVAISITTPVLANDKCLEYKDAYLKATFICIDRAFEANKVSKEKRRIDFNVCFDKANAKFYPLFKKEGCPKS